MNGGRTSIRRPKRRASDAGRSRLGDFTRPIARERSITQRLTSRLALGLAATTIALAIAVTLYVLPIRTWMDQRNELRDRQAQLDQLESTNADLQSEVDRLQTDAGIREAARDEIGYLEPGEVRSTMIDEVTLPKSLPKGWPYSPVAQIIKIRTSGD